MVVIMYGEYQTTAFYKCINDLKDILTKNYELIKNAKIILDSTWDLLNVDPFVTCIQQMKLFDDNNLSVHQATELSKFKNTETFYTALSNQFCWYDSLCDKNIDWKSITVDRHIVALVRRPTVERAEFIKLLLDSVSTYTRASFANMDRPDSYFDKYRKILSPYPIPMTIDNNKLDLITSTFSPESDIIYKSLCNVVCENSVDLLYLTEKTYKAFAWHQIPIFFAASGHVAKVRELGFDVFDDLSNGHRYDIETNVHLRKLKLISAIKQFVNTYQDIQSLRNSIFDRLVANNQRLHQIVEEERLRFDPAEHLIELKKYGLESFA